jgi:peptidoglycan/xylan/chitin deacetylase (PgdA/CDA1 family)
MVRSHSVTGPPGTALARLFAERRARKSSCEPIVAHVSGPAELLREAAEGLPEGVAKAEAIVARLRRGGTRVEPGDPLPLSSFTELVRFCRSRGASSVEIVRKHPSLLRDLQIGSWFHAGWQLRLARRVARRIPTTALELTARRDVRALELALELAFWAGVRSAATERELQRLTQSSYVAFYYHRIAGNSADDRLDVPPALFDRQLQLLRFLRFRPLAPEELLSFHGESERLLPRRSYVLTADDAFRDAVEAFAHAALHCPQIFAPTSLVGERLPWADGQVATWDELASAAKQGVRVGSHTRTHRPLTELDRDDLEEELAGSLADLRRHLDHPIPLLAYPHGNQDDDTRAMVASAGYGAAFTTLPGRNGAGSDAYRLSRIGVKPWDSRLSFLWKAVTGEHLPRPWERWRFALYRLRLLARRASRA